MPNMTKHEFPNGVRLVMEPLPHVRSVSAGLWIDAGSRNETAENAGVAHFLEHMFFKGAGGMTAIELADAMNRLGGHFNAFTSHEIICLHARLVDRQLGEGLDLLGRLLRDSSFPAEELDRERNVILEECKMVEDTPDELVGDLFSHSMWGDHPLGQPILGTPETIGAFKRDDLIAFEDREFTPERLGVAVAGAFDEQKMIAKIESLFGDMEAKAGQPAQDNTKPKAVFKKCNREKDIEQGQFCIGSQAPCRTDKDRYRFALLSNIIGGGMSSRIFKEVREKRGLAYSIGSFGSSYRDTGCWGIGGGASPRLLPEVIEICLSEIRDLYTNGLRSGELELAKEQLTTSVLFALESTSSRMTRLAEQEMYHGRFYSVDEILTNIADVTDGDIQDTAAQHIQGAPAAVAMVAPAEALSIDLDEF